MTVIEGEAIEEKIADELRNLVNEKWDFQVRKFTSNEFRVAFPDQPTLDTFSNLSEIVLAIHGLKVKISKSMVEPAASAVLQPAWTKIYGSKVCQRGGYNQRNYYFGG